MATITESPLTTIIVDEKQLVSTLPQLEERSAISFLDLPLEIRSEVYSHLFDSAKLSCDTPHATWPTCGFAICSCSFPHQLAQTCRQLRYEALPTLLSATTIEVAGSFDRVIQMPNSHLNGITRAVVLDAKLFSLRPIELNKLSNLKVLELRNVTVWCKFYDEAHLESPQADEAMYGMAMFNLKRISPMLMQWAMMSKSFKVHVCCQFVVNSLSDETIVSTNLLLTVEARG